jgi:hypothetical protein
VVYAYYCLSLTLVSKIPDTSSPFHLLNIYLETRAKIWSFVLLRPCKIVPGPVRYQFKSGKHDTKFNIYSYVWDGQRQELYEEAELPAYDGKTQLVNHTWTTTAIDAQLAMVEVDTDGYHQLPDTYDEEVGAIIQHVVCYRGEYPTKIVHNVVIPTTGILGVGLLATCKQAYKECAPILYSNKLVFDTRGKVPFTHERGVHEYNSLSEHPHLVPGLPHANGNPQTHGQTMYAIHQMFDHRSMHQPFMRRDPLATFLRTIGRVNAAYITDITIQGFFKTAKDVKGERTNRPISFARILPIHAAILKHACPNLERLALSKGKTGNNALWAEDLNNRLGLSDEQRCDAVVEKLVNALPFLKELTLDNYNCKVPKFTEGQGQNDAMAFPWQSSVRWEGVVGRRYSKRLAGKASKAEETSQHPVKGGRGSGANMGQSAPGSSTARINDSFAEMVDNAVAAAAAGGQSNGRPSFKRGKKLALRGNHGN